jgi:hypothetical protein
MSSNTASTCDVEEISLDLGISFKAVVKSDMGAINLDLDLALLSSSNGADRSEIDAMSMPFF